MCVDPRHWVTMTDKVLVLGLFLFVGVFYSRSHIRPDCRSGQVHSGVVPSVGDYQ